MHLQPLPTTIFKNLALFASVAKKPAKKDFKKMLQLFLKTVSSTPFPNTLILLQLFCNYSHANVLNK